MRFSGSERHDAKIPEGEELSEAGKLEWEMKELEERHARELDAQQGLNEWEMEERLGEDHLTGLRNRKFLENEIERSLKAIRAGTGGHARSSGEPLREFSLLFIDLDHFKEVNDTLGHLAGDEVLKKVAKVLTGSVRGADIVARFGGDEFCILLPRANKEDAAVIANKVRENLRNDPGLNERRVTASLGVCSTDATIATQSAETLIHYADMAAKKAKQGGKDRVEVYKKGDESEISSAQGKHA